MLYNKIMLNWGSLIFIVVLSILLGMVIMLLINSVKYNTNYYPFVLMSFVFITLIKVVISGNIRKYKSP